MYCSGVPIPGTATPAFCNQFNLTTRRFTQAQIEAFAVDPGYITRYGKLADRFGDNGVVSVGCILVFIFCRNLKFPHCDARVSFLRFLKTHYLIEILHHGVFRRRIIIDDIEEWDSLEHINLLAAVEQEFGMKFNMGQVVSMKTASLFLSILSSFP